jgi:hypothetical protein
VTGEAKIFLLQRERERERGERVKGEKTKCELRTNRLLSRLY